MSSNISQLPQPMLNHLLREIGPLPATAQAAAVSDDQTAVTPDTLMFYCQSRLRSLDDQINGYFSEQQSANGLSSAINSAEQVLNDKTEGFLSGNGDPATCAALETALQAAIDKAGGPSSGVGQKLAGILDRVHKTGTGDDNKMSADEVKGFLNDLKDAQSDVTSGAELQMIKLQSLVSQRSTAIQLCTNLMQSIDDSAAKIAGNLGH